MHTLRRTRWLTCFWLAWFSAMVGAAVASPLIHPQSLQWVCSGAGEVQLVVGTEAGAGQQHHTLECPLCLHISGGVPEQAQGLALLFLQPLAVAVVAMKAAPVAQRAAAPLPARGPPSGL